MNQSQDELPVSIREMRAEDLEQVQEIDNISFSMPWPASAFRYELFDNPASLLYVAQVEPPQEPVQLVGMIVFWMILDEAHIATLAVRPEYRGYGIARQLVAAGLRQAIHKGMTTATLEVRSSNLAAQGLYRHFRFKVVGRRHRYYRDNNEDALIMTVDGLGEDYLEWLESNRWLENNLKT